MPTRHFVHRSKVRKARRAHLQTVGLICAVGYCIHAELALRMLDRGINLTRRNVHTFGEELEVMDKLFHVRLHALTRRRCNFVVIGNHGAGVLAQPVDALLDDAIGLPHLLHPDEVAVIAVAGLSDRHIEFDLVVDS